ncbi:UNKNOWN [Stylonychia lemnae]|uniref:Uncharacterized protein n=1 Tax=Stylonychia lemnae TaxID=5949 RepID=A0A078B462_STYLE|nr:UNKNOWN [Stylonychia lemnae]|eukprot:CDW89320.1 UNKNOWN [Stylonychia lemnae]
MDNIAHPPQKQTSNQFDSTTQERQHKARINNNSNLILAQQEVFKNISSIDRLIAYSMNQNCQSIARTQHQQILSLLNQFKQPNIDEEHYLGKKKFLKIVKSRLEEQKLVNQDEEMQIEQEEQEEEEQYYDEEAEEEQDEEHKSQDNPEYNELMQLDARINTADLDEGDIVIRNDSDSDEQHQLLSLSDKEDEEL